MSRVGWYSLSFLRSQTLKVGDQGTLPARGEPGGILVADVAHGLVQHVLAQQLLHDRVRQAGE